MLHIRNKYEEMEAHRRRSNLLRFLEGLVIGHLVGILIGLFIAPKSGKETAKDISLEAQKLIEMGKQNIPKINPIKKALTSSENEVETELTADI